MNKRWSRKVIHISVQKLFVWLRLNFFSISIYFSEISFPLAKMFSLQRWMVLLYIPSFHFPCRTKFWCSAYEFSDGFRVMPHIETRLGENVGPNLANPKILARTIDPQTNPHYRAVSQWISVTSNSNKACAPSTTRTSSSTRSSPSSCFARVRIPHNAPLSPRASGPIPIMTSELLYLQVHPLIWGDKIKKALYIARWSSVSSQYGAMNFVGKVERSPVPFEPKVRWLFISFFCGSTGRGIQ